MVLIDVVDGDPHLMQGRERSWEVLYRLEEVSHLVSVAVTSSPAKYRGYLRDRVWPDLVFKMILKVTFLGEDTGKERSWEVPLPVGGGRSLDQCRRSCLAGKVKIPRIEGQRRKIPGAVALQILLFGVLHGKRSRLLFQGEVQREAGYC